MVISTCLGVMPKNMCQSSPFGKTLRPEAAETLKMLLEPLAGVLDIAHLTQMRCAKEADVPLLMLLGVAFKRKRRA